jgi:xanthine dehydrogenase accessory factor
MPPPELIVVGAGHIAVPLAQMASLLDFEVVVLDDRATFASRERFPTADTILVGSLDRILRERSIGPWSYLVLVTRGHQHDEEALKAVVDSPAAYVGMIGSRRRVREVFRHLAAEGVRDEAIARIHAPIGVDIGAETPAEIAAAIVGELVAVRRGRDMRRPAPHVAA